MRFLKPTKLGDCWASSLRQVVRLTEWVAKTWRYFVSRGRRGAEPLAFSCVVRTRKMDELGVAAERAVEVAVAMAVKVAVRVTVAIVIVQANGFFCYCCCCCRELRGLEWLFEGLLRGMRGMRGISGSVPGQRNVLGSAVADESKLLGRGMQTKADKGGRQRGHGRECRRWQQRFIGKNQAAAQVLNCGGQRVTPECR